MYKRKKETPWVFYFWIFCTALMILCSMRGLLVNPNDAVLAAEKFGFSQIEVKDHKWFAVGLRGCGSDAAIIEIEAINPNNKKVDLSICMGWPFKGATIRSY